MTASKKPMPENPDEAAQLEETSVTPQDPASAMPAAPSREHELQEQIDQLTAELAKAKDQWIRAVAETDNIRKRAQRDQEENARYAVTGFARDMVSVLENLKRAASNIPADARKHNELLNILGQGIDLTLEEMLGIFQRYGIKRLYPVNEKFDHNFHQAVAQIERDDVPPGTVVEVVQAGYVIHDRLLQPAMVAVAKAVDASKKVDTTA